jgi:bifunctional DNase/RNase
MGGVYIGSVYLRANGRDFHVDARPSDACALAIGNNAPIYVARSVLDQAGKTHDDVQQLITPPTP